MTFRKILFWSHLGAGFIAGAVFLFMALTGMSMSFAPQLTAWAEGGVSRVQPVPGAVRLPPGRLMEIAATAFPDQRIESLTLKPDPTMAAQIGFPKGKGGLFLDPYTGAVLGKTSRLRGFFLDVEHWHRWMGEAKRGEFLTHASALLLIFMVLSGWYLWIPRRRNAEVLKNNLVPDLKLKGRVLERNLHYSFGFWNGSILLIIALSGSVMGYKWVEGILFAITGSEAPKPPDAAAKGGSAGSGKPGESRGGMEGRAPREGKPDAGAEPGAKKSGTAAFNPAAIDSLFLAATAKAPEWRSVSLRLPQKSGAPATAMVEEKGLLEFPRRSRLSADAATGDIKKWEPFADQSAGKKLRSWMTPIHTGRGFGILGQIAAAIAAFSLALLVWTGIALGIRRLSAMRAADRRSADAIRQGSPLPPPTGASASGKNTTSPRHNGTR